ncbi:MAG TPA: long-chain fatty acid--CoA ligase, partial [Candidatus Bathyarchaeia archaeon]|nr:long-chain fatty acid--CoA ligase [Candidatus Bathyarchaeia archaeon]
HRLYLRIGLPMSGGKRSRKKPSPVESAKEQGPVEKPWFKFWPKDVPRHIEYPQISLSQLLTRTAEKNPRQTALIYFNRKITYSQLDQASDIFAAALAAQGVKKGDKVAIFLPNIPQFVIAYYGTLKIGAVVTAISPLYKEREIEHQLTDSEAATIVILDVLYPILEKVLEKTKVKTIIVANLKDYMPAATAVLGSLIGRIPSHRVQPKPGIHFFKEMLSQHDKKPPKVDIDPKEDLAALQYTGGTTGIAKGAMLTHINLLSNAIMCAEWLRGKQLQETFLAVLPLFHIYGMTTSMNAPIYLAGRTVMLPRFDPLVTLKAIHDYRVTIFCGAPTMYALLLAHPRVKSFNLSSVRFCISGSAPLPSEIQKKWMNITKGVLVEGYGLTESSPVTHCNPLDPTLKTVKIGSIGLPWPDTDAKIMDVETGQNELDTGQDGELAVAGPQIMKGYWKMDDESREILRNGWLYTGDIGKVDEDGYFYITDRKKDLIKYKGYSVYPREIEDVIYEHPAVKLCAVIGKLDPVAGEIPKAFIVLKEGKTATADEIKEFVNPKLAPYKAVREVEFRTELPMTMVGKVLKRILLEEERQRTAKT